MAEIEFVSFDEWDAMRSEFGTMSIDSYAFGEIIELQTRNDGFDAKAMVRAVQRQEIAEPVNAGYDYQKHNKVRRKR